MSRCAILHAAELHLDAPFAGVGRTPAAVAAALRDASLGAWSALVDAALAHRVDAVLLAGGWCGGLEHGVRAQARLRDGVARLAAHGVRVVLAAGASDPGEQLAVADGWPDGVVVAAGGGAATVVLERDGARLVTIHAAGIGADERAEDALRRLAVAPGPGPHVGLLAAAPVGGADTAGLPIEALRALPYDYWALGGAATFSVQRAGDPWVVTPGTPQARRLTAGGDGVYGAVVLEFEGDAVARVALEPLDRVRGALVRVDDAPDVAAARRRLGEAAEALRGVHAERVLIVEAAVGGRSGAAQILRQPEARAGLLAALRRDAERFDPPLWWAALRPPPAPALAAAADDLAGEVARRRAVLAADPERSARFLQQRFEPLRGAWTAMLETREAEALLDEAAALAVDALGDAADGGA